LRSSHDRRIFLSHGKFPVVVFVSQIVCVERSKSNSRIWNMVRCLLFKFPPKNEMFLAGSIIFGMRAIIIPYPPICQVCVFVLFVRGVLPAPVTPGFVDAKFNRYVIVIDGSFPSTERSPSSHQRVTASLYSQRSQKCMTSSFTAEDFVSQRSRTSEESCEMHVG